MDSNAILGRIKEAYRAKTYKELAEKLNISYSSIDNWRTRKKVPEKYMLKAAQECQIELQWIKTGVKKDLADKDKLEINNKLSNFSLKSVIAFIFLLEKYNNLKNKSELIIKIEEFYGKSLLHVKPNISLDFTSKLDRKILVNCIEYFLDNEDIFFIFNNKNYYLEFLNFLRDIKRLL